jgi:3-isopropylmalate dehydrogenase
MKFNIAVMPGDGIGVEITEQAVKVLEKVGEKYGHEFKFEEVLIGGVAIDKTGTPLPKETVEICKKSDAVLLGAVGGPKWDNLAGDKRPEAGLLGIRKELGLYANIRPAILHKALRSACPIREDIIGEGLDICVVRELTGGIYFGPRSTKTNENGELEAHDTLVYTESEVRRIAKQAFEIAMKRKKKVTSVDKANILDSSRLWRKVVEELAKDYPEVELNHLYVDNAAMQLVINPKQFDVILTTNMFGDILSDEASMITGSIGMLPSASLGGNIGLYEPIHGSAPDIAGQDKANPIATISSVAMMLRYSLNLEKEADTIENAITKVLEANYRTGDIMSEGMTLVGTKKMGELIIAEI